ncbi:hypothetical protein [Yersinia aleksiciae]|nr:hypothetical protein [Yersinia aleksiciae]
MSEKTGENKLFSVKKDINESKNPSPPKAYVKPAPTPAPPAVQKKD